MKISMPQVCHWSICQTPHTVSSDPRSPVSLKKKFGETVYSLSLISLLVRRTISQRQFSPIIIVIQTSYHLLYLYHSAFPEGRDTLKVPSHSRRRGTIAASWTPMRLSEIDLKKLDLHKIIFRHCDLLWAHKWAFWCYIRLRAFLFTFLPPLSFYKGFIFFRAVLGSQLNQKEGTENSYIPPAPTHA